MRYESYNSILLAYNNVTHIVISVILILNRVPSIVPNRSNMYVVNEPKHSANILGRPPNINMIANGGNNDSNSNEPYLNSGSLLIR